MILANQLHAINRNDIWISLVNSFSWVFHVWFWHSHWLPGCLWTGRWRHHLICNWGTWGGKKSSDVMRVTRQIQAERWEQWWSPRNWQVVKGWILPFAWLLKKKGQGTTISMLILKSPSPALSRGKDNCWVGSLGERGGLREGKLCNYLGPLYILCETGASATSVFFFWLTWPLGGTSDETSFLYHYLRQQVIVA